METTNSNSILCPDVISLSSYVVNIKNITSINTANCSICPLIKALKSIPGIPLGSLTIADLLQPKVFDHGIYLFEEGCGYKMIVNNPPSGITPSDYWYIGKCTSQSFSTRLGTHLAIAPNHYMNCLIRNIAWVLSNSSYSVFLDWNDSKKEPYYCKAADIMKQLRLKFISFEGIPYSKKDIVALEKCLIAQLHPYLNNPRRGVYNSSTLEIKS